MNDRHGLLPLLAGLTLAGVGYGMRHLRPVRLNLPRPVEKPRLPDFTDPHDIARQARDGLAEAMPDNLTDGVGRTLMIAGAGLILLRALDEFADDGGLDY